MSLDDLLGELLNHRVCRYCGSEPIRELSPVCLCGSTDFARPFVDGLLEACKPGLFGKPCQPEDPWKDESRLGVLD